MLPAIHAPQIELVEVHADDRRETPAVYAVSADHFCWRHRGGPDHPAG
jgi:hypothetical protein